MRCRLVFLIPILILLFKDVSVLLCFVCTILILSTLENKASHEKYHQCRLKCGNHSGCFPIQISCLCAGTQFYKPGNSKQKTRQTDNLRCAAACSKNPKCKTYRMQRDVQPQCVTYDEEIPTGIPDNVTTDLWVRECPKGFVEGIYQFQCYLFVEGHYSWYSASSICESKNAYVAELIDPEERDAVWRYAKNRNMDKLWLGITQRDLQQRGTERDFKFYKSVVDIPSTNDYWSNRFLPAGADHSEGCGYIWPSDSNSKFHDKRCENANQGFICEW